MQSDGQCHFLHIHTSKNSVTPFRTAVPFREQTSYKLTGLTPKRDCSSKAVKTQVAPQRFLSYETPPVRKVVDTPYLSTPRTTNKFIRREGRSALCDVTAACRWRTFSKKAAFRNSCVGGSSGRAAFWWLTSAKKAAFRSCVLRGSLGTPSVFGGSLRR